MNYIIVASSYSGTFECDASSREEANRIEDKLLKSYRSVQIFIGGDSNDEPRYLVTTRTNQV